MVSRTTRLAPRIQLPGGVPARFAGGTPSGAPTAGPFDAGDTVVTRDGRVLVCTAGGSPGTWVDSSNQGLPSGRTGIKPYSPEVQLYNWHSGNTRKWRTALALAKQGTASAVLNCDGDSITWGQYATTPWSDGWVGRLRSKIDTAMGVSGGTGVSWMWATYRTSDPRLTFTGTWTDVAGFGPFRKAAVNNADGSGASHVEFAATSCDSFVIYYLNQAAGAGIKWSVDGGAATVIPTNTGGANVVGTATVSAGALGAHTLRVWPNGGNIYVVGVEARIGTAGVRTTPVGYPGLGASSIILNSTDGAAGYQFAFDAMAPHLTTYMFGSNEFGGQQPVATYIANMTTTINRSLATGDVLLITTVPRDLAAPTTSQDTYHQVCYTLADSLDLPVLDVGARWGDTTASGSLYHESAGSRVHPNSAGYRDIADAVFNAIMPR